LASFRTNYLRRCSLTAFSVNSMSSAPRVVLSPSGRLVSPRGGERQAHPAVRQRLDSHEALPQRARRRGSRQSRRRSCRQRRLAANDATLDKIRNRPCNARPLLSADEVARECGHTFHYEERFEYALKNVLRLPRFTIDTLGTHWHGLNYEAPSARRMSGFREGV
jgi:hypothetical protein